MTAKLPFDFLDSSELQTKQFHDSLRKYQAEFCLNEVASQNHTVYRIGDASLRPPAEKSSHWSIAWSDLMMTMFILFLSLFVYQALHKDLLVSEKTEIIGGETRDAIEYASNNEPGFPFVAIKPSAPLIASGTVRKVEPISVEEIDLDSVFTALEVEKTIAELAREIEVAAQKPKKTKQPAIAPHDPVVVLQPKREQRQVPVVQQAEPVQIELLEQEQILATHSELPQEPVPVVEHDPVVPTMVQEEPLIPMQLAEIEGPPTIFEPLPLGPEQGSEASVNELFDQSVETLNMYNLNDFAAIDLIPDNAVRIVLKGDLLFDSGEAALSPQAIASLEKIASVISDSPNRIHIEGHTDDMPISSPLYSNNWQLSVARANAVATFLIEDMGMDPGQFVISGYSSYQPVAPNTSAENRAVNRRVEIVVKETHEQPHVATLEPSHSPYEKL